MNHSPKSTAQRSITANGDNISLALLTAFVAAAGLLTLTGPQAAHAQPAHAQPAHAQAQTISSASFAAAEDTANNGPVRLARFSYIHGNVTWRGANGDPATADEAGDGENDWADAAVNIPLQQGAQIWVSDKSRAELQFDDGSRLRLNANTLITLQTLFSDADGEFTQITLNGGEAYLRLTHKYGVYQVNTPLGSVKAFGPARLRIATGDAFVVGVRQGSTTVEGTNGKATRLSVNNYLSVSAAAIAADAPFPALRNLPLLDDWDRWNIARDRDLDGYAQSATYQSVPVTINLWADNLDGYGVWRDDPAYGRVWYPTVMEANWRPYYHGQWVWSEPWGWTWVGSEPWGWTPYHYGTWFHAAYGWGWRPGPGTQYWSPAVVSFYQTGNSVAWCPLAPREVHYPTILPRLGFKHGHWPTYFSMGGAATYYPGAQNGVFEPRRISTTASATLRQPDFAKINRTPRPAPYIPQNALAGGGSSVSATHFGQGERQRLAHQGEGGYFVAAAAPVSHFRMGQMVERINTPPLPFKTRPTAAGPTVRVLPSVRQAAPAPSPMLFPPSSFPVASVAVVHPPVAATPTAAANQSSFRPNETVHPVFRLPIRERTAPAANPAARPYSFAPPTPSPLRPSGLDAYLRERGSASSGSLNRREETRPPRAMGLGTENSPYHLRMPHPEATTPGGGVRTIKVRPPASPSYEGVNRFRENRETRTSVSFGSSTNNNGNRPGSNGSSNNNARQEPPRSTPSPTPEKRGEEKHENRNRERQREEEKARNKSKG